MKDEMIIKGDWSNFLNLEGEELFLVKRRHIFVLLYPLFLIALLASIFSFASYVIFSHFIYSFPLFLVTFLLILSISMSSIAYSIVYWYFHIYVLTNRKILEVWYTPLSNHAVNDIFLDKVNCTEIDLTSKGFFHELIDMGDLTITFDRPTHQEEFTLRDIKNCDEIDKLLTQKLLDTDRKKEEGIWLRPRTRRWFARPAI